MASAKIMSAAITTVVHVAATDAKEIMDADVADEDAEKDHLKNVVCYNCEKKGHYSTDCRAPKKNGNEESNMVSKADFKNLFQYSLKEMLSKKEKQNNDKSNMELEDESLDMNIFDKLMEGKQHEIVINNDDGSMSIANTNKLFHF
jgi:hypothetical protein